MLVAGQKVVMTKEGREQLNPLPRVYVGTVVHAVGDEIHVKRLLVEKIEIYHEAFWEPMK